MPRSTNAKLLAWVDEIAALTTPDRIEWCDGSADEYDRLCQLLVEAGHLHQAVGRQAAQQLLGPLRPGRRGPGGGPHLHLLEPGVDAGPTNNWRDPAEMRGVAHRPVPAGSMKGRTMYVVPFSMGPLGSAIAHIGVELTDSAVRGGLHADHDAHGQGRPRGARRRRRLRALPPLGRCPAGRGPGRCPLAVRRREQVHRPLPRDPRDLVRTDRATAGTPCSARSASPCASRRSWPATTAGWPSTC